MYPCSYTFDTINSISDLNFEKQKLTFSEEEFKEIAESIRNI